MSSPETEANCTKAPLPADVNSRLLGIDGSLPGKNILILPTRSRNGVTHYLADDVNALKMAASVGLDVAYLIPSDERTYLEEYSADWALELGLAVIQSITVEMATGIGSYLLARAKQAVAAGLHRGPATEVPVRLSLARYERDQQGRVCIENLKIEGGTKSVAAIVQELAKSIESDGTSRAITQEGEPSSREGT